MKRDDSTFLRPNARLPGKTDGTPLSRATFCSAFLMVLALASVTVLQGQFTAQDTGPRAGSVDAGKPVEGLSADQERFFMNGQTRFKEVDSVSGNMDQEAGVGLGPTFNSNQCSSCHSQPAVGGSSPSQNAFPFIGHNPQVAVATLHNASNRLPFFIALDGPVREARFKFAVNPDGTLSNVRDGGVHDLFTIMGRTDATNAKGTNGRLQTCQLDQPNFEKAQDVNNLSLRIPTPVFGAGLIENIDEDTILDNMTANGEAKRALGISGHANRNGNDGTIARFGWKAQNKSLQLFAAEAYNVEMGVTNEVFPTERGFPPNPPPDGCNFNSTPEDTTNLFANGADTATVPSDAVQFSTFMRLLDQPKPACKGSDCSASIQNGRKLFVETVKCALCHTPTLTTAASPYIPALSNLKANLFSDLLVHHMGSGLADDIVQGAAGPDEFRTAPLWGVGQRVFFLHDGRTSDLLDAIRQHASPGSEANGVIRRFNGLTESQKQDLLNFLRSL
jgi:CxxC motif-containing protein (DUF1111 family)